MLACVGIAFDPEQRIALYVSRPFIAVCYVGYYATQLLKARAARKPGTTALPALRRTP
ncbi:hypothetical protein [Pseudomonas brassicae]|uniref:hypothetical protein n=1 Tax=Pseudomonas brassicae TaxID=2708063 RepID=UPI001FB3B9A3|nr:hypothetical protein [Pseudomonas brassicae]